MTCMIKMAPSAEKVDSRIQVGKINVYAPTRLLQTIIQDQGLANENFPKHTGEAIVLDGIGYMDAFMAGDPEGFLEYADWMGIPIIPFTIALDRLKSFLAHQVMTLNDAG